MKLGMYVLYVVVLSIAPNTALTAETASRPASRPARSRQRGSIRWVNARGRIPEIPRVEHRTYDSKAMNLKVGVTVYTPPGYEDGAKRYPVLYWLHGVNGNEWNYLGWFTTAHEPTGRPKRSIGESDNVISLQEKKKVPPMIVVFVNGGRGSGYRDRGDVKSETTIVRELIPFIDKNYRTIASREGRAIEGFSMGGSGSLSLYAKYPDLFCSVVGYAGYLREDGVSRLKKTQSEGKYPLHVRLAAGSLDRASYRDFHTVLQKAGIPHDYEVIEGVGHNIYEVYQKAGLTGLLFHVKVLRPAYKDKPQPGKDE